MDTVPHSARNDNLDIPRAPGIYKITCLVNKRIYIGSAIDLRQRKSDHFKVLRGNRHHNRYLQRAWNKYGEGAFTFEVWELVLPMSLTAREQYWLDKLKPFGRKGFNIYRDARSPLGIKRTPEAKEKIGQANRGRKHTPEELEKMRQSHLGKKMPPGTGEKISQAKRGKKMSPEAIERSRQANTGRKQSPEHAAKSRIASLGRKNTPEHNERIRQALIGKKYPPERVEKNRQAQQARWHKEAE